MIKGRRKKTKYGNKKTIYDGITFDSIVEKDRYILLRKREKEGKIQGLKLQKRYLLQEAFKYRGKAVRAIHYVADFYYIEDEEEIVEDVKGVLTEVFKIKQKIFKYIYPDINFKVVVKENGMWKAL